MTAHCPKCGAQTDEYFKCASGCDASPQDVTTEKLAIAVEALEQMQRMSTEALEKIK